MLWRDKDDLPLHRSLEVQEPVGGTRDPPGSCPAPLPLIRAAQVLGARFLIQILIFGRHLLLYSTIAKVYFKDYQILFFIYYQNKMGFQLLYLSFKSFLSFSR